MRGHLTLQPHGTNQRWLRQWPFWRSTALRWLVSATLVTGMVLAFHAVASEAVHQSELRQQALAAQSRAVWRCKLLASQKARSTCLLDTAAPT